MKFPVFFGKEGLTSTSANHIANMAKEYIQGIECELNNMQFYATAVTLIGSQDFNLVETGNTDDFVDRIPTRLDGITQAKSLIAWIREAIKAREKLLKEVEGRTIEEWAEENNVTLPVRPQRREVLTLETAIEQLSVKDRNRYYALQTKCAVLGKAIHPDGTLSEAREDMKEKERCDCKVNESGRDTLIYKYSLTASSENVDKMFFKLQAEHRQAQAEFNGIAHQLTEKVENDRYEAEIEYRSALNEYEVKREEIQTHYEQDQMNLRDMVLANTKIVIPHDLDAIYNAVNNL